MMAYESHLQPGSTTPGAAEAAVPSKVSTRKNVMVVRRPSGTCEQKTENFYMLPIAFAEVIVLIVMVVMNYLFRFNESVRDLSSLAEYKRLSISLSDVTPARPYFDYTISIEKNQNQTGGFGITFNMEEYAFFVPLFIFPLLLVLLVELVFMIFPKGHLKTVKSFDLGFNTFSRRSMRIYYVYLFYASMTGMVTSFIKLLVAKPRPHFLAVCSATSLNLASAIEAQTTRVYNICHPQNWSDVNEALRSFPSYHATVAFYAGTFLVLYLMYMMHQKGTYSTGGLFSLPVIVMATIGGLHRWCTFHADGWDVAWGAVIGIVGALWAVYGVLNCFQERVWALKLEPEVPELPGPQDLAPLRVKTPVVTSPPVSPANVNPAYSIDESDKMRQSSPQPNLYVNGRAPSRVQRIPTQYEGAPPPRSPAQAFNQGFGSEPESPRSVAAPYNVPRQRYSVPAVQMRPVSSRPPSAHPALGASMGRRPASRYEGASYF